MKRWVCSVLVATTALVACGSSTTPSWLVRDYRGVPAGFPPMSPTTGESTADSVFWGPTDQIAIVTWGSSGCPRLPMQLNEPANNVIVVTLSSGIPSGGGACITDLGPTTSLVRLPSRVEQTQPLTVTLIDAGDVLNFVLAPRPRSS